MMWRAVSGASRGAGCRGRAASCSRAVCLALLALLAAGIATGARAQQSAVAAGQQAAAAPAHLTAEELQRLVGTLQDDKQRALLVEQLRGLIAAQRGLEAEQPAPASVASDLTARLNAISGEIVAAAGVVVDAPRLLSWFRFQATEPTQRAFWLEVALKLSVVFGFALFGEWLLRTLLRRPRGALVGNGQAHFVLQFVLLLGRAVLDALPILAFAAIAHIVLHLMGPRFATAHVTGALVGAYVTTCIVTAVARVVLLPRRQVPIISSISGETRGYLYIWLKRFTYVFVWGHAIADGSWWLGVPGSIYSLLLRGTGLVLAILAAIFVLQNRVAVGEWLRGRKDRRADSSAWRILRNRFADTWHVLAVTYVVGIFLVYALRVEGGFVFVLRGTLLSIVVIIAARLLVNLFKRFSRHGFAIGSDLKSRFPTLEARANRYLPVLTLVVAALVYAFAALAILQSWSIESFSWLDTAVGRRLTSGAFDIVVVLFVALVLWEIFASTIERYLTAVDPDGTPLPRSARARTLLPLLRTTMLVLLIVLVSFVVLSEIGVDIGPLLAGAGVVGIAIGFGSQALVKDVITGLFILIEDQFAVGDVVDVGNDHSGVVEAISIRTIRLRDAAGTVHTVPFSAVASVKNMTRDYAYYVADIGVAYREDTDEVVEVLREVGAELRADPAFTAMMLEPIEIVGVTRFADSSVIIQVRLKTPPIKQWAVGREFNRRIKKAFDARGIDMPVPQQTIFFGVDKRGNAAPAHVRISGEPSPAGGEESTGEAEDPEDAAKPIMTARSGTRAKTA